LNPIKETRAKDDTKDKPEAHTCVPFCGFCIALFFFSQQKKKEEKKPEKEDNELPTPEAAVKDQWEKEQLELKEKLITTDQFSWSIDPHSPDALQYLAGVDISFISGDSVNACAMLVVLSYPELKVVYETSEMIKLTAPYIAGFLAFREVPHLVALVERLKNEKPEVMPQVIFVDGNGFLHPRGFGIACHLGVLCDIPTIGIGKNFLVVDQLTMKGVKHLATEKCVKGGDWVRLVGASGTIWGAAFRSTDDNTKPVFVSIGHRISLETAVELTKRCCLYRVPEPIRQADQRSRKICKTEECRTRPFSEKK